MKMANETPELSPQDMEELAKMGITPEALEEMRNDPEMQELIKDMGSGVPKPQEKSGIYGFFNRIIRLKDSTKTANLSEEELISVRALREGRVISVLNEYDIYQKYFDEKAESILATSDSKLGFLVRTAVTTKREVESKTKKSGGNKGWFKKKEEPQPY
jgi:hypothetical protein